MKYRRQGMPNHESNLQCRRWQKKPVAIGEASHGATSQGFSSGFRAVRKFGFEPLFEPLLPSRRLE
jgi:hypothetical protein